MRLFRLERRLFVSIYQIGGGEEWVMKIGNNNFVNRSGRRVFDGGLRFG
jgi:hypothetical protein